MLTVTLKSDIEQQLNYLATTSQPQVDTAEIVNRALRRYLREMGRQKIRRELQAFEQQRAQLLENYLGYYVAIHEKKVIDQDVDLRALNQRVFKKMGRTPVLHKKVTDEPERDIVIRNPRLERISS